MNNRPKIKLNHNLPTNPAEAFQNKTLRPIIKMLNDLLVDVSKSFITKYLKDFNELSQPKKEMAFRQLLEKNQSCKNLITGMVIGNLTEIEFQEYLLVERESNRRIIQMVIQRVWEQL